MGCGADTEANALMTSLLAGVSFDIPVLDLSGSQFQFPDAVGSDLVQQIVSLTNEDLTTRTVGGSGTFDALMASVKEHLKEEYDAGRITGADYTKAYIELTAQCMGNATQFLLGKDKAFWDAQLAQIQAIIARTELEITKIRAVQAQVEVNTLAVNYAATKIGLATADITYCTALYNHENLQPMQLTMLTEQAEAQRAQTMDTRSDGVTPVAGQIGKQKELYTQQITSYQRDAETKAAKIISDAWITQKTIDEGLTAPNVFTNAAVDGVLGDLMTNNGLTVPAAP